MGELANSGIPAIGSIPWGSHFCQFYETADDLADTLVPYFKAGLDANEQCMWVTSSPFGAEDALSALRNAVPDVDRRMRQGQIEIIDHQDWYLRTGKMGADEVIDGWLQRKEQALARGYSGFRLTGNTYFLEAKDWDSFTEYESKVNDCFCNHRVIALCSYCLAKSSAGDVMDVVKNHQFALTRRHGEWTLIEHGALKRAKEELRRANEDLERRVDERTADLSAALAVLRETTANLQSALSDKDVLLREVHHRVKNNLQIINSLLTFKALRSTDSSIREAFNDTLRRVTAMSLVHEALYQQETTSAIDFGRYLTVLCEALSESFGMTDRIRLEVVGDGSLVHLDAAIPLGLIATEAISNAMKHAFPNGGAGSISVTFNGAGEGKPGLLTVRDDGTGAVDTPPAAGGSGTGFRLVHAIAKQVGGQVRISGGQGTTFTLDYMS
ncbi:MEDS domain-containing protein [Azospirillum sp. A29]|uniref:MEDS domain-containing protein n=1 Tax=Azospirillum sp. A29 TaxID=3160606 RepID=UPI0036727584